MKRLWLVLAILLLVVPLPLAAQGGDGIYLPIVVKEPVIMSDWKVEVAEATTNQVLNPSSETTGNYAALPGTVVTQVTTYSKWGLYSYRVQTNANDEGISLTLSALANAIHYATVRVRGTLPTAWDWSLDNATYTAPTLIESLDSNWSLYGLQFPAAQANGSTTLYIRQNGAGAGDFYLDGIQVEEKTYWTTYTDGDQPGCEWNGAEHASTSSRSAQSRAGGRVRDLQTDYSLRVNKVIGAGAPPQSESVDEYALLPGGELGGIKVESRTLILAGNIIGTSWSDLHAKRQALIALFDPDAYPEDEDGVQPVRLRYTGAAVQKEIAVHYTGGLDATLRHTEVYWEKVSISFLADDPFWYEIGESSQVLATTATEAVKIIAARLKSTGQWDGLGPPGAGVYTRVRAIARGRDGTIYVGGDFLNFDGTGSNYVAQYDPITGTWAAMGTGLNDIVWDIAVVPNGQVYVVGEFTDVNGGPGMTFPRIIRWDPSTSTWNAVGVGLNAIAHCITVGADGTLYIGGTFTDIVGGPGGTYNRIIQWDPIAAAWAALSVQGLDAVCYALATGPDGDIYAGGWFQNAGGNPVDRIGRWDVATSTWNTIGSGIPGNGVYAIAVRDDGRVYAGGTFMVGVGNYLSRFEGTEWEPFPQEPNNPVYTLCLAPDGTLHIGGQFTAMGTMTLLNRMAEWNGSSFTHPDVDLPGAPIVYEIIACCEDPVISRNYDLYIGFDTSGNATIAGIATVTNNGTTEAFPKIVVERSGGTLATLTNIRNETTGRELLYNCRLTDGEILTTNLKPTEKSIISNYYGPRLDAILAGCDFGQFVLQPGSNDVTCFVPRTGVPTITAYMVWRDVYKSFD